MSLKVIVRNGFTALDAAALCVYNNVSAAQGLADGLWGGHDDWFHGGAFLPDVEERVEKMLNDEGYRKIYDSLVANDLEMVRKNVAQLEDKPVKWGGF